MSSLPPVWRIGARKARNQHGYEQYPGDHLERAKHARDRVQRQDVGHAGGSQRRDTEVDEGADRRGGKSAYRRSSTSRMDHQEDAVEVGPKDRH